MAQNKRTLRDYDLPSLDMVQESITRAAITINNLEIKPATIQMIQNNLQFRGTLMALFTSKHQGLSRHGMNSLESSYKSVLQWVGCKCTIWIKQSSSRSPYEQNVQGCVRNHQEYGDKLLPVAN
ncbi:hypothetical protein EPI10_001504 [Gossypium australe]|uniref:Uncharacterized protein n=1 Tax=Gossypium australe TaxID=47621 RepID=A0A5B6VBL3_9ROSI|nr:hypothetical protein EPI10_001504 [Gossypium australe]